MSIFRREFDVQTGVEIEIPQYAYRSGDEVVVLDASEEPPIGYARFDPVEEAKEV